MQRGHRSSEAFPGEGGAPRDYDIPPEVAAALSDVASEEDQRRLLRALESPLGAGAARDSRNVTGS